MKILKNIAILFTLIFYTSFGYSLNNLEGIKEEKLSKILFEEGYKEKTEDDEFGKITIFDKRTQKYEQQILINYDKGNPYQITIYSWHFHVEPNEEKMLRNLKETIQLLVEGIENKELIERLEKSKDKIEMKKDFEENYENYDIKYYTRKGTLELQITGERTGGLADYVKSLKK